MTYALPTNITGMYTFAVYVNTVTEGHFGWIILLAIGLVSLLVMKHVDDLKTVMLASSILVLIFAVLFWIMGLIGILPLVISLGFVFLSVILRVAVPEKW